MPTDPTLSESANAEPKLGFDLAESVDALVTSDTRPGSENTDLPKNTEAPESPAPSYVRPTSSIEAYTLLHECAKPVLIGDYLIERRLGQGGMGAVYQARQLNLDREVALKVLARHLVDDEKFVHRFKREARVMARLDHPNIIRCYDVGEEFGLNYLAMEFVDGSSLQTLLERHQTFSVGDALYVTVQVAEALQYAHEVKMVHRDVKPDNVLVTTKGVIKLADLGLAKPVDDDLSMTASGVGAGTPSFMAPEQMRSAKEVDGRADIYALGAMLYLMLTGQQAFAGDTLVRLLEAKEKGKFKSARKLNPKVPDKLDLMIEKMLAKSLTARYQTCADIIKDIQGLGAANFQFSLFHRDTRPASTSPHQAATPAKPSLYVSRASEAPPVKPAETPTGWWYVDAGVTPEGKRKVRKLTYDQVKEQIRSGHLSSTNEVSRQPGTGYRSLTMFRDFELLFRAQVVKKRAERRAERLQSSYAQIEEEIESYERRRWWGRVFNNFMGWVVLFCGLAVLCGIGYLVYLFGPDLIDFIARKLGAK